MSPADATLRPAIPDDPGSGRSLEAVGPLAVLGAMVEQRRASRPASDEIEPVEPIETRKAPQHSDAFLKAR